ncbi:MAG: hypothetical protein RLZZ383_262 [Pseudomonadota bacterium]
MFDLYGIPTCGTVKKAVAWFTAEGLDHRFHDLRATPPTRDDVAAWVDAFGARALRNTSGGSFRALGPEKDDWDDTRWAAAFLADPMLIKRPVIVRDGVPLQVVFAKPPAI